MFLSPSKMFTIVLFMIFNFKAFANYPQEFCIFIAIAYFFLC